MEISWNLSVRKSGNPDEQYLAFQFIKPQHITLNSVKDTWVKTSNNSMGFKDTFHFDLQIKQFQE